MPLPGNATKVHLDAGGDDPKQARAELVSLVDIVNAVLAHLAASTITSTPLTVGEALEAVAGALRVKLDGATLVRSAAGLKIANVAVANGGTGAVDAAGARANLGLGTAATQNYGTAANQLVRLDGSARLPAVNGSLLTNLPIPAMIFNDSYDSGELTIAPNDTETLNHGLGVVPKVVVLILRCKIAELGYSVGHELLVDSTSKYPGGFSVRITSAQILIKYSFESGVVRIQRLDNGNSDVIVNNNWRLIVRAYG